MASKDAVDRISGGAVLSVVLGALLVYVLWHDWQRQHAFSALCDLLGEHVAEVRNPTTVREKIDNICLVWTGDVDDEDNLEP